jgi:hypothetical protein
MTEPVGKDERLKRIARARAMMDRGRSDLFAEIRAGLADGITPGVISHPAQFSREYITRIRDGKAAKRDPGTSPRRGL